MPTHYIPERVTVVTRPPSKITQEYSGRVVTASPAFAVPSDSPKMLGTARCWAKRGLVSAFQMPPPEQTLENCPMKNLQVMGVEHRSEGGVAFKVITDQGFYFDLREPEFMEALFTGRISKDGVISGEYVWSVGGNQMRIVRVGSEIYNERLKAGSASLPAKASPIAAAALVVGDRYRSAFIPELVYAGRIRRVADRKLFFAWYEVVGSYVSTKVTTSWKKLIVSSTSIAQKNLGASPLNLTELPLRYIQRGDGVSLEFKDFVWEDGQAVERGFRYSLKVESSGSAPS